MAITLKAMRGKRGRGNKWAKLPKADPPTEGGKEEEEWEKLQTGKPFRKEEICFFFFGRLAFSPENG